MSFTSAHNDYLDPDKWNSQDEHPEWWDEMEINCSEFMAEFSCKTWYDFYRPIYKYTDCGPTIGVLVYGAYSPVYCDCLREVKCDEPVIQVYVNSIVEGSEAMTETHVIDMSTPGALARFWEALEAVNNEASQLWNEANQEPKED